MSVVDVLEAGMHLSRLVEAVESGAEKEIIIARDGKPIAKLVPVEKKAKNRRLGLMDGRFPIISQEEFDADNETIRAMIEDGPIFPDEGA